MSMGAKFRETPTCNKSKLLRTFQEVVGKLKKKLGRLSQTKSSVFDKWESVLLNKIKAQISKLSKKSMEPNEILTTPEVANYIRELHCPYR